MESRIQRFVLGFALAGAIATSASTLHAAENEPTILDDVVSPDIERREIREDKIDPENIEVGIYAGVIGIEDFGSNDVFGARVALHITEDIFAEINVGSSTLQKTSYELLSGDISLLSEEERDYTYYSLSLGYNLFPAQMYLGKLAFNSNFYLFGGAGNTDFAGSEYLTVHFGAGFRFFATDAIALRVDFRNHVITHEIFAFEKEVQNLEAIVGLTLFL